jgi:hypothetical protein
MGVRGGEGGTWIFFWRLVVRSSRTWISDETYFWVNSISDFREGSSMPVCLRLFSRRMLESEGERGRVRVDGVEGGLLEGVELDVELEDLGLGDQGFLEGVTVFFAKVIRGEVVSGDAGVDSDEVFEVRDRFTLRGLKEGKRITPILSFERSIDLNA